MLIGTPDPLAFGDQRINTVSPARSVTVTNTGNAAATAVVCTTSSAEYAITSTCPNSLAIGGSFVVTVTFEPLVAALSIGTLAISYDDGTGLVTVETVALTGTGVTAADLVVNGDWSSVALGTRHIVSGPTAAAVVSMANPTGTSLTIVAVTPMGADCSQFTFVGLPAPGDYAGGWSSSFTVAFDPNTFGAKSCDLDFTTSDFDPPSLLTVTGTGVNQTCAVLPAAYDFGSITVAAAPLQQFFDIHNSGEQGNLNISSVTLSGAGCIHYELTGVPATPFAIAADGVEGIAVLFDPATYGRFDCNLLVVSNDPTQPTITVPLTGIGLAPDLALAPASPRDFGARQIGRGATAAATITLTNNVAANSDLSFGAATDFDAETDPDCDQFQFAFPSTPLAIAPGEFVTFTVAFDPSAVGTASCDVAIHSNDPAGPHTYRFTGAGTQSVIDLTPVERAWGEVQVNSTSDLTVTITNAPGASAALTVSALALSGPDASQFAIVSPATPFTLDPGAEQAVTLRCAPTSAGPKTAALGASHDADVVVNASAALTCTGVAPALLVTPSPIAFAPTYDCAESAELTVTLQNQGAAPIAVNSITSGSSTFRITAAPDYPVQLGASGGVGDSVAIGITFVPPTVGNHSAELTIGWDAGPTVVPLTGEGSLAAVAVTPLSHDYGAVRLDGAASAQTYRIQNTGAGTFDVDLITLDNAADFTLVDVDAIGATLTPGGAVTFRVDALPLAVGGAIGTVAISTSLPDPCASTIEIALAATGVIPSLALTPADAIAFGPHDVQAAGPATRTLVISNSGSALLTVSGLALTGDDQFVLAASQATSLLVAAGASASVAIEYRPTLVESNAATLAIASDAAGGAPVEIDLTGRGVDRELSLSATRLEFPTTYRNAATPPTLDLEITNLGEATLHLATVDTLGAGASVFALVADLPDSIAGGATATVTVEFDPDAAGLFEAYLQLTNDDTDEGVARVDLTGSGRVPGIVLPTLPVDFGQVEVGVLTRLSQTAAGPIRLVNQESNGFAVRELKLVDVAGNPSETFRVLDFASGTELVAGATMEIDLQFVAAEPGQYEATLEIFVDADPLRVAVVTVQATAVPATADATGDDCGCRSGGDGTSSSQWLIGIALCALTRSRRSPW